MTTAGVTGRVEDTVKIHKMTQWETDFSALIVKMFQKLKLGFNITVLDLHESMCPNLRLHLSDSNAQKRKKKNVVQRFSPLFHHFQHQLSIFVSP